MTKTWRRLAEALGIETEAGANWQKVNQKRNMQRYGTSDRRDPGDPQKYFNTRGTGLAQRQATAGAMQPQMTPKPGGLQIPSGTDRPGQGNPLVAPPKRPSLSNQPPQQEPGRPSWSDMLDMSDEDDDGQF